MKLKKWQKLSLGIAGLFVAVLFFSSGFTPPGPAGAVLRHNQSEDIDASPLFYSEVENMADLEAGVAALRDSAAQAVADSSDTLKRQESDSAAADTHVVSSAKLCDPMKGECN